MKNLIPIFVLLISVEVHSQYIDVKDTIITKDNIVAGKEYWTIHSMRETGYFPNSIDAMLNDSSAPEKIIFMASWMEKEKYFLKMENLWKKVSGKTK